LIVLARPATREGDDVPVLIDEFVPGVAALGDDAVVGPEDAGRKPVDRVDGAPAASKVPRWMLSQTHLREPSMGKSKSLTRNSLIPLLIDQNPCAHWRSPRDMMRQGRSMRVFQA
jgi:hypothetical protein